MKRSGDCPAQVARVAGSTPCSRILFTMIIIWNRPATLLTWSAAVRHPPHPPPRISHAVLAHLFTFEIFTEFMPT
jgi:hypothetical protein